MTYSCSHGTYNPLWGGVESQLKKRVASAMCGTGYHGNTEAVPDLGAGR